MKRATWKGEIKLGDVSVPVSMYTCVSPKEVKLHRLHNKCKTKIKQEFVCPNCQQTVRNDDTVQGVEITPNSYLLLSEEEIKSVQPPKSSVIEALSFALLSNIIKMDPIYVHSCYYLLPEEKMSGPYTALITVLNKTKTGIVATITMRTKQRVVLIYPYVRKLLRVVSLHYTNDIDLDAIVPEVRITGNVDKKTIKTLTKIIKENMDGFDQSILENTAEKRLSDLINKKLYTEGGTSVNLPKDVVDFPAFIKAIQNVGLKEQEGAEEDDIPMLKYKRAL